MLRLYAVALLFVVGACTSAPIPEPLRGQWTPTSVGDCGDAGETLDFSTRIIRHTQGGRTNLFMIVKKVELRDGFTDIHYEPPAFMKDTPSGIFRFDHPAEGRMRAIGTVSPDGDFEPVVAAEIFDLVRCDLI